MISAPGLLFWGITAFLVYKIAHSENAARLFDVLLERLKRK